MTTYPRLAYLAGAYFHQDYDLDAPTPPGIIRSFIDAETPGTVSELAAEIRSLLDSGMADSQIGDLWITTWHASYEPSTDGLTYRGWLAATLTALEGQRSAETAENFAARPDLTDTGWRDWPAPIRDKHWVDRQGNRWHIRGSLLTAKQARRLLRRPDVAVLHAYGFDPRQVTGPERAVLVDRIEQFFAGTATPMTDFAIAEFRDDQRHVMLIVQESC